MTENKLKKKLTYFFKEIRYKEFIAPWVAPILSAGFLLFIGTLSYRISEGWDWGDSLWMVIITISTIGYGEVEPLSAAGRVVTVLIISGGLIVVQLTIQRFLRLVEYGYFKEMRELRFRRKLRRMKNHVIICGFGRTGQEIASQLQSEGIEIVIVELEKSKKIKAEEKGLQVLLADATNDETLILAGIMNCKSLIVTLPSNAANLYVILSAKGLHPACRLIARAENEEVAKKLKLAGATAVVSPYVAAGRTMAASALRPIALDFMDLLAGSNCEIEELLLSKDSTVFASFENLSLAELQLGRKSGAMILAIRNSEELITNPSGDVKIGPGQLLVALGNKKELSHLKRLLGKALLNVEKVNC
tara:strand:- start:2808 stop:3890 length:1083 start_codon:yes stop_codon:yes gene_type:complete